MKHCVVFLLALALCAPAAAPARAVEDVLPDWPRPFEGLRVAYRKQLAIGQRIEADGHSMSRDVTTHRETMLHVVSASETDGTVVEVLHGRTWGTIQDPEEGLIHFDSDSDDELHPFAAQFMSEVGTTDVVRLDPNGRVLDVRLRLPSGGLGEPDAEKARWMQSEFALIPTEPVAVGASWVPAVPLREIKPPQLVELETRSELEELDARSLKVVTTGTEPRTDGGEPAIRVEHALVLSLDDGLPLSVTMQSEVAYVIEGIQMEQRLEARMERVR